MSAVQDYEAEITKTSIFDGKDAKWREWSSKFLLIAAWYGYRDILLGIEKPPPASKTMITTEEKKTRKANYEAYSIYNRSFELYRIPALMLTLFVPQTLIQFSLN